MQLLGSEGGGGQGQSSKGKVLWPEMGALEWLVCKQVREEVEKERERERERERQTDRQRQRQRERNCSSALLHVELVSFYW